MKKTTKKIATKKFSSTKSKLSLPKNKNIIKPKKELKIKPPQNIKTEETVEKVKLLNANQVRTSLKYLTDWQTNNDHKMIYREFILRDFTTAINLVNRIAEIAEEEKHHPDVHLTQFRNLRVGMTTHEVGGLSDNDFIVAKKIDALPVELRHK